MNPLYLSGFGVSLNVDRARLVVRDGFLEPDSCQDTYELQPRNPGYDSIVIDGHTGNLTLDAIKWSMRHNMPIFVLDYNGTVLSSILPREPISSRLKIAQVTAYEDSAQRLLIARKLIEAKIQKTKGIVEWLSQRYEAAKGIDSRIQKEERLLTDQHSLNGLMMVEGRVAEVYWSLIAKILPSAYSFKSRIRGSWEMNASDPTNALLNYGYSFLETVCRKHLNAMGLDPIIGFLHEMNPSKHPLVYDLQEPFRWLVDTTVVESLENREFKKSDFFRTDNYALRLKPEAVKKLLNRLREAFNSSVKYQGRFCRWETIIFLKAQELARHLIQKTPLDFLEPSPNLERSDTLELRKRILSLSQSDAKELGIAKSTLHYLREHAREERSFVVYHKVRRRLQSIS